ncbi:hypothetical protein C8F04DRAFT_1179233 [Mycena alexandri]|uniref:Uncharacterized protein n=1 Tax=Mycena alexandri TaxID=1745969 RepID=A0AAD6T367_9AGAR|nr:hypothetical protein C8F04DRAFT_1179233 [Mycena alexandri]
MHKSYDLTPSRTGSSCLLPTTWSASRAGTRHHQVLSTFLGTELSADPESGESGVVPDTLSIFFGVDRKVGSGTELSVDPKFRAEFKELNLRQKKKKSSHKSYDLTPSRTGAPAYGLQREVNTWWYQTPSVSSFNLGPSSQWIKNLVEGGAPAYDGLPSDTISIFFGTDLEWIENSGYEMRPPGWVLIFNPYLSSLGPTFSGYKMEILLTAYNVKCKQGWYQTPSGLINLIMPILGVFLGPSFQWIESGARTRMR